jgi:hypothetical protein
VSLGPQDARDDPYVLLCSERSETPDTGVQRTLGSPRASLACPGEPHGKERITFCSASPGSHGVQGYPRPVGLAQTPDWATMVTVTSRQRLAPAETCCSISTHGKGLLPQTQGGSSVLSRCRQARRRRRGCWSPPVGHHGVRPGDRWCMVKKLGHSFVAGVTCQPSPDLWLAYKAPSPPYSILVEGRTGGGCKAYGLEDIARIHYGDG